MPTFRPTAAVLCLALAALVGGVLLAPTPAASRSSGANPGFAGNIERANGDPQTCTVCHSSAELNAGPGTMAIDAPASVGASGRVSITVSLDAAALQTDGRQGFEATVRDPATGDLWGTLHLVDAVDTQYASNAEGYVTHTTSGTARDAWTFEWDPAGQSGTARVYATANAANNDGGTLGDFIYAAVADVTVQGTGRTDEPDVAFRVGSPRPHPARAGAPLALDVTLDQPGRLRVRLVDGLGRSVREVADGDRPAGTATLRLGTAGLAAGVYAVQVQGPGGQRSRPLVVVR